MKIVSALIANLSLVVAATTKHKRSLTNGPKDKARRKLQFVEFTFGSDVNVFDGFDAFVNDGFNLLQDYTVTADTWIGIGPDIATHTAQILFDIRNDIQRRLAAGEEVGTKNRGTRRARLESILLERRGREYENEDYLNLVPYAYAEICTQTGGVTIFAPIIAFSYDDIPPIAHPLACVPWAFFDFDTIYDECEAIGSDIGGDCYSDFGQTMGVVVDDPDTLEREVYCCHSGGLAPISSSKSKGKGGRQNNN